MAVKEVVLTNVISDVKYRCGFVGAGAGTGAVIRKGAVLGNSAGMVRFAGAGAVLVRVEFFAHFGVWEIYSTFITNE